MAQPPVAEAVMDFHARLTPRPDAFDQLIAAMDATGITCAGLAAGGIVSPDVLARQVAVGGHSTADADNGRVLAACKASGGRLFPVYFANPHAGAAEYRRTAEQYRGLEISPAIHGVGFAADIVDELVEIAARHRHFVYAVCLTRPGSEVADLAALAARHRDVDFVLGHGGVSLIDFHALNTVSILPNIHVETCGPYTAVIRRAWQQLGSQRLVFSGEHPLQPAGVELAKYAELKMPTNEWNSIAWHNGRRLFRIEEP